MENKIGPGFLYLHHNQRKQYLDDKPVSLEVFRALLVKLIASGLAYKIGSDERQTVWLVMPG